MLDNKITSSIDVLEKFKNNTIWSGATSVSCCNQLNNLIPTLNNELSNIDKFEEALTLLDKIIQIDKDINTLRESIWTIPVDANQETINRYSNHNAGINNSIQSKIAERTEIRKEVISILSGFNIIADIQIINIPDIEGAIKLDEPVCPNGAIYEFTTSSNEKYQAFVPYELDPTKPVILYDAGDSGNSSRNSYKNWKLFLDEFEQNGYDHIILRSLRYDNSKYYNDIVKRLNLTPSSKLFVSHSGGTTYNFYEYCDLLEEGNDLPGVIAVMDGYTPGSWFENKGVTQKILDSETIVLGFNQKWKNKYLPEYENFAKSGVNMLILTDNSDFGCSHNGVNESLIKNNILDYLTGKAKLPDNYSIKYWNPNYIDEKGQTGGFVTVNYEDIKTIDDVYNFFGVER